MLRLSYNCTGRSGLIKLMLKLLYYPNSSGKPQSLKIYRAFRVHRMLYPSPVRWELINKALTDVTFL